MVVGVRDGDTTTKVASSIPEEGEDKNCGRQIFGRGKKNMISQNQRVCHYKGSPLVVYLSVYLANVFFADVLCQFRSIFLSMIHI